MSDDLERVAHDLEIKVSFAASKTTRRKYLLESLCAARAGGREEMREAALAEFDVPTKVWAGGRLMRSNDEVRKAIASLPLDPPGGEGEKK